MIEPMTVGSMVPSGFFTTRVYRPSCALNASFIRWSAGMTPTPQIPQLSACHWFINRSRYIAW